MPVCYCCHFAFPVLGNQQLLLTPLSLFCNTLPIAFVAVLALLGCCSCHPQLIVAYYAIFTFLLCALSLAALLCICQCHGVSCCHQGWLLLLSIFISTNMSMHCPTSAAAATVLWTCLFPCMSWLAATVTASWLLPLNHFCFSCCCHHCLLW